MSDVFTASASTGLSELFLWNTPYPKFFNRNTFKLVPRESLHTQDSEKGYGLSSRATTFLQNTWGPNFLFITVFVPGHSRGLYVVSNSRSRLLGMSSFSFPSHSLTPSLTGRVSYNCFCHLDEMRWDLDGYVLKSNLVLAIFFLCQDVFLVYSKKVVRREKSKWWLLQFLSTKKWDIYVILASLIFLCLKNMKTALTCLNLDCKIFNWKLEHFPLELMNLFYKFEIIISLLDIGQS